MLFEISFTGHKNIRSTHKNTIEITKDSELTVNGDCIVGVNAFSGCKNIPNKMKKKIRDPKSTINFSIKVKKELFITSGKGHKNLKLSHPTDIVLRKSSFVCPRTIAIKCNKASDSIPKKIIKLLQNPKTIGVFSIEVI